MRQQKTFFGLLIALSCVLFLSSCGSCKRECRQQYDRGYSDGRDSGYSSGYKQGRAAGYSEGKVDGYNEGESVGLIAGRKAGYADGTKALVKGKFVPTLGGSLLILVLLSFLYFFHKSIGIFLHDFFKKLSNIYSHFLVKLRLGQLEKSHQTRVKLSAKIMSLNVYHESKENIHELDFQREYHLVGSQLEMYLTQMRMMPQRQLHRTINTISKSTRLNSNFSQSERSKLLSTIKLVLLSRLADAKHLADQEKISYEKTSKQCIDYIASKKKYIFYGRLRKGIFVVSVAVNVVLIGYLAVEYYRPGYLSAFGTTLLQRVAPSLVI